MKKRSAASLKCLLEEKITALDMQITHLQAVRTTLCSHRQNMDTLLTMDLSEISIVEKEKHCLVTVDIDRNTSFEQEVELITAETEKYQLGRLHKASYGSMISVADLLNGRFDNYSKLFIEIPFLPYQAGLHIMPSGKYLRAFHKGEWNSIPKRYQEILDYVKEHKMTLHGFSYEMGINENVIDRIEDYIVKIEIPVSE